MKKRGGEGGPTNVWWCGEGNGILVYLLTRKGWGKEGVGNDSEAVVERENEVGHPLLN